MIDRRLEATRPPALRARAAARSSARWQVAAAGGLALAAAVAAAPPGTGIPPHAASGAARLGGVAQGATAAYLPSALRHADRQDRPPPTVPVATATSHPATVTPTASPTPTVTPTPVPLAMRIAKREVPVEERIARPMGQWTSYPIVTALRYDGSQIVGWSSTTGRVHVTPLGREGSREGPDIVFQGASIHGLVAHAGGGAALYVMGDEMRLRRFDDDGTVLFEHALVGTGSHGQEGAKWIDDWSHEGRLAWTGEVYAAYFGHTQNWGSRGNHQGDLLWIFDADGHRLEGTDIPVHHPAWSWGCSHSIDVRLEHNPTSDAIGPVCLSDEHPADGVIFSRSNLIASMRGDGGGRVEGELGGLVRTGSGFTLTFVSRTERSSYDIGLAHISRHGFATHDTWLTETPRVDETSAHLARYGDGLLAAWKSGGELLLSVLDIDGNILDGALAIDADVGLRDDFVSYEDGRAGWTYAGSGRASLISVVVATP